jgi:hypothetical protein
VETWAYGSSLRGTEPPSNPFRAQGTRWGRWLALGAVAATLCAGLLSVVPALVIRHHLQAGANSLFAGEAALLGGRLHQAEADFQRAGASFEAADHTPGGALLRMERLIPFVGRTPDTMLSLADIGRDLALAGVRLSSGLSRLPGGTSALSLSGGRIPIPALRSLAPAMHRALASLAEAESAAVRLPDSMVLGPVADARDVVRDKLAAVYPLARSVDALLASLPGFAGEDRPRRYFVAAQNSAELRGTGGLIGNFAILTIDDGRMSLAPFQDIRSLPNLPPSKVRAPSPEFAELYDPFGGAGFWLNLNMTPDAPAAASAIESLYARVTGQRLDGTIFFDLQGLADLLGATGPVRVDPLGVTVSSGNLVRYVATAGYLEADIPHPFSEGPRLVAQAVWDRFLAASAPDRALRSLVRAAGLGHLVLHSADPELQRAFSLAAVAGELGSRRESDFLGVVLTNAAANKVDYYLHEDVRYDVTLGPDGAATADVTVRLRNDAPAGARPSYSLGPFPGLEVDGRALVPGENRSWTSVYCAPGCALVSAAQGDRPAILELHHEDGLPLYAGFVQIRPQRQREIHLSFRLSNVWDGDAVGGVYRLHLRGQTTIVPTTVTVTIHVPAGMEVGRTSVPMEAQSGAAGWHGEIGPGRDLLVEFHKPLWGRIATRVWGFLSAPAFHF